MATARDHASSEAPATSAVLEARGIRKSFHGIEVLHGVDFALSHGEVHGVVGQNGAGKSTLMKILNGVYKRDAGEIRVNGTVVDHSAPQQAQAAGIAMVFQDFSLVPTMTVAQNILLDREPHRLLLVDDRAATRKAKEVLAEIGVEIDPGALVSSLPVGSRQLVEIAKALSKDPSILVLDEPTASLSLTEIETLFAVVQRLVQRGIAVAYISHHLQELMRICTRVTVLRDGHVTLTAPTPQFSIEQVIGAMLGSSLKMELVWQERSIDRSGTPLLRVRGLWSGTKVRDVSFDLYAGEVIGIAGLLGSGRSEVLRALFGVDRPDRGTIEIAGMSATIDSPRRALRAGMALVPEDRRRAGLVPGHTVKTNVLMSAWRRVARLGFVRDKLGDRIVQGFIDRLKIRTAGLGQPIDRLSGGNQQKVVVAKNLTIAPRVLLLDDPTVGIDVKSKADLLDEVRDLTRRGNGVVLVSSELEELSALADRVLILRGGAVTGWLDQADGDEISEASLSRLIQGT